MTKMRDERPVNEAGFIIIARRFLYRGEHRKCRNGEYKPVMRYIHEITR